MKYTTKKCPNCGHAYVVWSSADQRKIGCPLLKCNKCGNRFWDKDIKEPALYGFEEPVSRVIGNIFSYVIWAGMTILFGVGAVYFIINDGFDWSIIFFLIIPIFFVYAVITNIKKRINDKKRWPEIIKERQKMYDESVARLSNENYLKGLSRFDSKAAYAYNEYLAGRAVTFVERPYLKAPLDVPASKRINTDPNAINMVYSNDIKNNPVTNKDSKTKITFASEYEQLYYEINKVIQNSKDPLFTDYLKDTLIEAQQNPQSAKNLREKIIVNYGTYAKRMAALGQNVDMYYFRSIYGEGYTPEIKNPYSNDITV